MFESAFDHNYQKKGKKAISSGDSRRAFSPAASIEDKTLPLLALNSSKSARCESPRTLLGGVNSQNGFFEGNINSTMALDDRGTVKIDWIQGSLHTRFFPALLSLLESFAKPYNINPVYNDFGRNYYDRSIDFGDLHILVLYDSTPEKSSRVHNDRFTLIVQGQGCSLFTPEKMMDFLSILRGRFDFKPSRLDLAFDDYAKTIDPLDVAEIAKNGNISGFRTVRAVEGDTVCGRRDSLSGSAAYFGSRQSGKMLRYYDKSKESEGAIDAYRWEVEFKTDYAPMIFDSLCRSMESVESFARCIGGCISSVCDFIDRESKPNEKNIARFELLPWWSSLSDRMGKASKMTVNRVKTTVRKQIEYLSKLKKLVAIAADAMGSEFSGFLDNLLSEGREKITSLDRANINFFHHQVAKYDSIPI